MNGSVRYRDKAALWQAADDFRESVELRRDPIRLAFAIVGPIILILAPPSSWRTPAPQNPSRKQFRLKKSSPPVVFPPPFPIFKL